MYWAYLFGMIPKDVCKAGPTKGGLKGRSSEMLIVKIILILGLIAAAIALLVAAVRTGRPLRSLFSSAVGGVLALLLISATGSLTGAGLALNGWTLLCAGTVGIPGVIFMLAARMIWNV